MYPLSYQLYSSRHFPPLEAHFPTLKAIGYDAVEPWLPAYEADPAAFRRALDDAGLKCLGFHMPLRGLIEDPQRFIDIALTLGAKWMIPPYVEPADRGPDAAFWSRLGETLARGAEKARPPGLEIAWHNHDFEFMPLADGQRPIDLIVAAAGNDVWLELDLAWVLRGGADPVTEYRRFRDRVRILQLKDTAPLGTRAEDGWTPTGDGIVDWDGIIALLGGSPVEHLVAEHDNPADWQRFARRSAEFVRARGL